MKLDIQDPRLIDYALGELEESERAAIEQALAQEENADARKAVRETQALASLAQNIYQREQNALTLGQRSDILEKSLPRKKPDWDLRIIWGGLAAVAVLLAIIILPALGRARESARRSSPENDRKLAELMARDTRRTPDGSKKVLVETKTSGVGTTTSTAVSVPAGAVNAPTPAYQEKPVAAGATGHVRAEMQVSSPVQQRMSAPAAAAPPAINRMKMSQAQSNQLEALGYPGKDAAPHPAYEQLPEVGLSQYSSGESYAQVPENTFLSVAQEPLSTFSIDVDTASYSNIRRFITQGQMPPVNAVRIEEMVNYFKYNYAAPTGEHPFAVHVEMAQCPWAPDHRLAKIGLKGKEIDPKDRPAGNFVFLLDVSGSMDMPNKLPLVKESMKALLKVLNASDRVGIVTYAGDSRIALPSTSCEEKDTITKAIDGLSAGGSTNGAAGIAQAYEMAARNFISGGINRVIIATDGDFNIGVTSRADLLNLISEKAKSKVFLTALGYGMGNLKDGTLEMLADKGNGNYAYIDQIAEARKVLVEQLTGTLVTIAKDVKIQVEFNPAVVREYRLIGYEDRALANRDFTDDTKDAGEIGAGHTVTALYELVPVNAPKGAPPVEDLKYQPKPSAPAQEPPDANAETMTVKLRYKLPEGDTSRPLDVPVKDGGATYASASEDFRFGASVAEYGMLLKHSQYKGNATLDSAQKLADAAKGNDPERQAFVDMVTTTKTLSH